MATSDYMATLQEGFSSHSILKLTKAQRAEVSGKSSSHLSTHDERGREGDAGSTSHPRNMGVSDSGDPETSPCSSQSLTSPEDLLPSVPVLSLQYVSGGSSQEVPICWPQWMSPRVKGLTQLSLGTVISFFL